MGDLAEAPRARRVVLGEDGQVNLGHVERPHELAADFPADAELLVISVDTDSGAEHVVVEAIGKPRASIRPPEAQEHLVLLAGRRRRVAAARRGSGVARLLSLDRRGGFAEDFGRFRLDEREHGRSEQSQGQSAQHHGGHAAGRAVVAERWRLARRAPREGRAARRRRTTRRVQDELEPHCDRGTDRSSLRMGCRRRSSKGRLCSNLGVRSGQELTLGLSM